MNTLGNRLIKLRKQHKLKQNEASKQIGISSVSLSRYENGNRTPDTKTLHKIADFYDVSPSYLLFGDNNKTFSFLRDITEEEAELLKDYLKEIRAEQKDKNT